jgi:hypothetical protein
MLEVDTLEEDLMTLGGSPKLQSTLIKTIMDTIPKTEKYALISKKFGRNGKIWVCSPGIPTIFLERVREGRQAPVPGIYPPYKSIVERYTNIFGKMIEDANQPELKPMKISMSPNKVYISSNGMKWSSENRALKRGRLKKRRKTIWKMKKIKQ